MDGKRITQSIFRSPYAPYILLAALLLGLVLAVATLSFSGNKAPLTYTNIPVVVTELAEPLGDLYDDLEGAPAIENPHGTPDGPPVAINPDLVEDSEHGAVPSMGSDGQTVFEHYRRHTTTPPGLPVIAILVTELGMIQEISERATVLPTEISLSYSPYAPHMSRWLAHGRSHGHEVFTMLPLASPFDYVDRGPLTLSPSLDERETRTRLLSLLSKGDGYIGVVSDAGVYADAPETFLPIATELANRGLAFIELDGTALRETSTSADLRYLSVPRPIDSLLDPATIVEELRALERQAGLEGAAVGYIRPYPLSLDVVWRWAKRAKERGLALVTVSDIMERLSVR
jgi:polysaccharide deacetylase 2 family uncharacterized protein YibQ